MTNAITRAPFEYDLFSPKVQEDPYAVYGHLLAQGPVYYNERRDFYALARFDDVDAALRDWQRFSSSAGVRPDDLLELQGPSIIAMVPPRHRQLRQVVQPAFLPAQVAQLEPLVEKKALKLLEDVGDRGEVDIVDVFVKRLPVLVICELMGLPERDGEMLKHWADEIVECSAVDGTTPDSARTPTKALSDYFIDQLAARRRRPGEDLISRLVVTAPVSVQGVPIPAGATVILVLGAADRDPRVWDAPNELRLSREPRRNLAFGAGIHHCIGAPLARLEGRVALPLLLSRMPEYEVVSAERAHDVNLHTFKRLVLRPGPS